LRQNAPRQPTSTFHCRRRRAREIARRVNRLALLRWCLRLYL
jgi:hypothetical protein